MLYTGIAVLVLLQIADLVTTKLFLARGHTEANKFARWLMESFGFSALIVGKIVVTGAAVACVLLFPQTWWVIALAIVVQAYVVGGNLMALDLL